MKECPTCGQRINAELAICPYCGATSPAHQTTLPPPSAADRIIRREADAPTTRGRLFDPMVLERRPAGFGMRFVAEAIDLGALVFAGSALSMLTVFLQSTAGGRGVVGELVAFLGGLVWFGFCVYDTIYLPGVRGSSIGKRVCGIVVLNEQGGFLGFGGALIRQLAKTVSALPCMLGFLWVLWDRERRAWHDKMANSFVYFE